ncbi:OLC1v1033139C1 [Oldenlandia corymbosa var. corymbosa]|uniref:GAGA-binding transcriptional activator n=1 Tax=Oldenlandia corymbosa var. corymbosa TaxID=529605 RepID=A0AAV1CP58_OLDCO|nr:OLC1v1033139C1 [Oldenlandia corymbosa var. corymbosa]
MDDDGLNMKNWGYYEPSIKGNLGLQLMSSMVDREPKPFISGRDGVMAAANGMFQSRDYLVSGPPDHMDMVRDNWINHRDRFHYMFPGHVYNSNVLAEPSGSHQMQMLQQPDPSKDTRVKVEDVGVRKEAGTGKKRPAVTVPKTPKSKKPKKGPAASKENGNSSGQRTKAPKKNMEFEINGIDISGIPIPVCSCTGTPQQCYRWGCGGWQSACCTTTISMYPLPMSTKRRGARIAGRKMSQGAFKKVLEKLVSEGYNFANAIDLRSHWAKHGTNKFVIIR